MPIAAFDAKQFRRGKVILVSTPTGSAEKYFGFNSQLGAGVIFKDDVKFLDKYIKKNVELRDSFKLEDNLPFYSSTHLKQNLGLPKTIAYADQLITEVQDTIETIHCSFVILPPKRTKTIPLGGFKCPVINKPTNQFIDNLGPMFSYLTAHSYIFKKDYSVTNLEFYIDAFRSNRTRAWDNIVSTTQPKIFWRGDECNAFISCADLIAFLTDVKLYDQKLKLEPTNIEKAWNAYSFNVSVNFYDERSLNVYSWNTNEKIDVKRYIASPTIYLSVDEIEKPEYAEELESSLTEEIGVGDQRGVRKFHQVIKRSDVFYSAIKYAYHKNGSMKIFHRYEDMQAIKDGDVFVYVGSNSKKIGETFQDAYAIELISGLELRKKIKEVV